MKSKLIATFLSFSLLFSLLPLSVAAEENVLTYDPSKYTGSEIIELNVYNWGEYISDGSEGTLNSNKMFEDYCLSRFGIRVNVNYTTYDTNENMYNKLKSSAVSYDIVIPSDYMIQKMASEGMLIRFDASSLPNYKNIDAKFKSPYYDPDNVYSVPYTYGMMGIIYNRDLVDAEDVEEESWGLLWNDKYAGKILQFNNPRDAFGTAMYWKGLDINSTNPDVWNVALAVLKEQKPLLQGYVNDEIFNKMETNSASVAPYFAGDFLTMYAENDSLDFYYPKDGTNYFVDAMCIPTSSKNPYLAMEYINFMLAVDENDEENSAAIANALYIGYATPNAAVRNSSYYIDSLVSDDWYGDIAEEILYGTDPIEHNRAYADTIGKAGDLLKEAPCYKSFSPEIQSYVNTLWENLKTESATELWVHISAGAIVAGVLALAVYSTCVKKIRSRDYRKRDKLAVKKRNNANNS